MAEILGELTKYPVATRLSLSGPLIVARDIAHAKLKERLDAGGELPAYVRDHGVYYAGPAKRPAGRASGSFGPTTAGRMDSYVDLFQSHGGSMVMLAKGNRSAQVTEACKKHGGFYLGSIGGPAARLADHSIRKVDVLEYPELGMEAIWKIEVEDFPAFIVVDDKGNDFFARLLAAKPATLNPPRDCAVARRGLLEQVGRQAEPEATVAGRARFDQRSERAGIVDELTMEAGGDTVRYLVNGTEVSSPPRSAVDTDGITGLRVTHPLNMRIDSLDLGN